MPYWSAGAAGLPAPRRRPWWTPASSRGFELDDYHPLAPLHSNSLVLPASR